MLMIDATGTSLATGAFSLCLAFLILGCASVGSGGGTACVAVAHAAAGDASVVCRCWAAA